MSRIGFRAHYNQIITNHQRISHAVHMLYILRHAICIYRFHIFMKIGLWVTSVCICKAQGPVTMVPSVSAKTPCREARQLRMIITKQVISIHVISFPQMYKFSSHVGKDVKALSLHLYFQFYLVNELSICTSPWLEVMMRHDPTGMVPRILGWLSSAHRWKHR